jgi:hypothetical protein
MAVGEQGALEKRLGPLCDAGKIRGGDQPARIAVRIGKGMRPAPVIR